MTALSGQAKKDRPPVQAAVRYVAMCLAFPLQPQMTSTINSGCTPCQPELSLRAAWGHARGRNLDRSMRNNAPPADLRGPLNWEIRQLVTTSTNISRPPPTESQPLHWWPIQRLVLAHWPPRSAPHTNRTTAAWVCYVYAMHLHLLTTNTHLWSLTTE